MDPASIVSIIEGSLSLALQCGNAARHLYDMASQHRNAKITLVSMSQNLDTMQLAWSRIGDWSHDQYIKAALETADFWLRLERSLEAGTLVLNALGEDLVVFDTRRLNFSRRTRLMWNQGVFEAHQSRIRDQASSMSLLLQTIQL